MIVLGIETSCDETAAAVVTGDRRVLADEVLSQLDEHDHRYLVLTCTISRTIRRSSEVIRPGARRVR